MKLRPILLAVLTFKPSAVPLELKA